MVFHRPIDQRTRRLLDLCAGSVERLGSIGRHVECREFSRTAPVSRLQASASALLSAISCASSGRPPGKFTGERIDNMPPARLRLMRRRMQIVFQDPFSSLDPRQLVRDVIAEPIANSGVAQGAVQIDDLVASLLDKVGLPRDAMKRFPHEFSGGQRQRIDIARQALPAHEIEFLRDTVRRNSCRIFLKKLQRGDAIAMKVDGIGRLSNPVQ